MRDAVAAARAAFPRWSAVPWQERAAILDRAADIVRERRFELAAWLIFEMGKNRVEALGEIEETADLYAYYAERDARERRLRPRDGAAGPDRHEHQRAPPVRRVGRHRALELPLRAARRAGRGGVGCRQHRRHEAVLRDAAVRGQAGRDLRAGGRAARRDELPARQRPRRRRRPAGSSRRRGADVHRLLRRRLRTAVPEVRPRLPQALRRRDGRQEPRDRHAQRRHRAGGAGRASLRVRHERAQVLRLFARLRPPRGRRPVPGRPRRSQPTTSCWAIRWRRASFLGPVATATELRGLPALRRAGARGRADVVRAGGPW